MTAKNNTQPNLRKVYSHHASCSVWESMNEKKGGQIYFLHPCFHSPFYLLRVSSVRPAKVPAPQADPSVAQNIHRIVRATSDQR